QRCRDKQASDHKSLISGRSTIHTRDIQTQIDFANFTFATLPPSGPPTLATWIPYYRSPRPRVTATFNG
ncbi:MAG: hypothetical protein ACTHMB_03040, partial [Candidatus Binatia bacterium]